MITNISLQLQAEAVSRRLHVGACDETANIGASRSRSLIGSSAVPAICCTALWWIVARGGALYLPSSLTGSCEAGGAAEGAGCQGGHNTL